MYKGGLPCRRKLPCGNGDLRRHRKNKKKKYRHRNKYSTSSKSNKSNRSSESALSSGSSSSASSLSGSSSDEKNPGNTVHKNKYKQNWLWNRYMDGDRMNVNLYAPQFNNLGPSGADLFFGRKWWYFNQDNYKPIR
ncbi:uncharacterized protein LOC116413661 [Galleria mellonella]|uniref:Uncharacterized protein LOC116413661 n=1 Tax=Galleria mellonella TaxID=7137 RepID=A0ABM3MR32_GALME|nr:uncharacterized protein LOC116413661 [Galleria mellonella]